MDAERIAHVPAVETSPIPALLLPGVPYFVELMVFRPVAAMVLHDGLARLGLGHSIADTDRSFETASPEHPGIVRFVTLPDRPLLPRQVGGAGAAGAVCWARALTVAIPLFAGSSFALKPATMNRGSLYDLRVLVRTKRAPRRNDVIALLENVGFRVPEALCLMKKDMRIPGRPEAAVSQWYVRAGWNRGDSILTADDEIAVEEFAEIGKFESPIAEESATFPSKTVDSSE